MRLFAILSLVSSFLIAGEAAAQARIFCCQDAKGRKVCADFMPPECTNRAYEERSSQGHLLKKYAAPLTAEQQARHDAELVKAEEEKRKVLEGRRQALALASNYANEKEIDATRDRSLAVVEKNLQKAQAKLEAANKEKLKLDREKDFYKKKPMPREMKTRIRDNDSELKAQQAAVDGYIKEMDDIRARFADEKRRYLEVTGKKPESVEPAAGANPQPAPDDPAAGKK